MPAVNLKSPFTALAGAAILLLLAMLLPWYQADLGIGSATLGEAGARNAWRSFAYTDLVLFLATVAAFVAFALNSQAHAQAANAATAAAGLGAVGALLVLYRIINAPGPDSTEVKIGPIFGLLAAAGLAVAAYRCMSATPAPASPAAD